MSVKRDIDLPTLPTLLAQKSHFLLGPRATGKTFLLRHALSPGSVVINLLRSQDFLTLSQKPWELEAMVLAASANPDVVAIDEIQKLPMLLDEVQRLIEERGWRFLLTGSSARKLRHGAANLLGGRAYTAHIFPLTWHELSQAFDLGRYLRFGGLPGVVFSANPQDDLWAYAESYLNEEIRAEGLVRNLPAFSRFMQTAAHTQGQMLNYTQVANDAQVPPSTVREYYSILEDTLVGFLLPAWRQSKKRKAISTAKFYWFDLGVAHVMAGLESLDPKSEVYGRAFEHFIAMELRAYISYRKKRLPLCYWRSVHNHEVDFVVGDTLAIETKASQRVGEHDLRGLKALNEEGIVKTFLLVSQDPTPKTFGHVLCLPWQTFLARLWNDELL